MTTLSGLRAIKSGNNPTALCSRQALPVIPETIMLDLIFVVAGLAFFAATIAYTFLCEKL